MSETDLFGQPVPPGRSKHYVQQRGYAAMPGTGPVDHTCGDCKHIFRTDRYRKCLLMKARWSHGYATDILARSPACKKWETT